MSVVELMANGTIPADSLAAVWWALERGASVFVVAGPSGIGKTTLAGALLTFLPENARIYVTSGPGDPIEVEPAEAPTYLLINELSQHTHFYLSGEGARRAFARLDEGVRILGALHARSASDAVQVMHQEADASAEQIGKITLVVVLSGLQDGQEYLRRVAEIGLLSTDGPAIQIGGIAAWDLEAQELKLEAQAFAHLAEWAGTTVDLARTEIAERAHLLVDLTDQDADQELIEKSVRELAPSS